MIKCKMTRGRTRALRQVVATTRPMPTTQGRAVVALTEGTPSVQTPAVRIKRRRRRRRRGAAVAVVPPAAPMPGTMDNVTVDPRNPKLPQAWAVRPFRQGRRLGTSGLIRGAISDATVRAFVETYIDPNGEFEFIDQCCKVPDGAMPNSGFLQFRELVTLRHPFSVPGSIVPPGTGVEGMLETWTVTILSIPLLRRPAIFVANMTQSEMSNEDMLLVVGWWNNLSLGDVAPYPQWIKLSDEVYVTFTKWSTLANMEASTTRDTPLVASWRMCHKGFTVYNNTPDIVNQGIAIGTQSQSDWAAVPSLGAEASVLGVQLGIGWNASSNVLTITLPPITPSDDFDVRLINLPSAPVDTTFTFTRPYAINWYDTENVLTGSTAPDEEVTVRYVRLSGPPTTVEVTFFATVAPAVILVDTPIFSSGNLGGAYTYYVDLLDPDPFDSTHNTIKVPPFQTQTMVQSSTKTTMLLMKEDQGVYMPIRKFQPVFNVQQAANYAPVKLTCPGMTGAQEGSRINGPRDTVDLNFGFGCILLSAIPIACSPTIKMRQGTEWVAGQQGTWQPFMSDNPPKDEAALAIADAIAGEHPFMYPASYNDMGGLLNMVESILGRIPILGSLAPALGGVVREIIGGTKAFSATGSTMNRLVSASTQQMKAGMQRGLARAQALTGVTGAMSALNLYG